MKFVGPVDSMLDRARVADAEAVVREAVTNAAKYAEASRLVVEVAAAENASTIQVADNGVGLASAPHTGGLANLQQRAHDLEAFASRPHPAAEPCSIENPAPPPAPSP